MGGLVGATATEWMTVEMTSADQQPCHAPPLLADILGDDVTRDLFSMY